MTYVNISKTGKAHKVAIIMKLLNVSSELRYFLGGKYINKNLETIKTKRIILGWTIVVNIYIYISFSKSNLPKRDA